MAWSDREWVLDGAAVRVSMVGFDGGAEIEKVLDGIVVETINADLTASVDITIAKLLQENLNLQYEGTKKGADFDIDAELAQQMLTATNISGRSNVDVVHPWVNGADIVRRPSNTWIIDFGVDMSIDEAKLYELPFNFVEQHVKPKYESTRRYWWLHERTRPEMRTALNPLDRFIGTSRVAKHRIFVWLDKSVVPDSRVVVIARDDDYFFGVVANL